VGDLCINERIMLKLIVKNWGVFRYVKWGLVVECYEYCNDSSFSIKQRIFGQVSDCISF